MPKRFCVLLLLISWFIAIPCMAQPATEQAAGQATEEMEELSRTVRESIDAALQKVNPSIVRIMVVSTSYRDGREMKYQSSGSGVIVSPDGYVVTNHHVAGRAARLRCTLANKELVEAELIGKDALTDIAVIKLIPETPREFPVARFGDSSKIAVGDYVLAMGSPMALSQSVTMGIVSNTQLVMPEWFGQWGRVTQDGEDVGSLVMWIAHDAPIYGGNSGGPLINLDGEIIGINEIRIAGLGGAIPGNLAKYVSEQLIEKGEVERSWLGVQIQPRLRRQSQEHGVLVSSVYKDSPADAAGLKAGDLITNLAGEAIDVEYPEQLPPFNSLVAGLPIGQELTIVVLREGEEMTLTATTRKREDIATDEYEFKQWGLTVRNISSIVAKELKLDSTDGAMVTSVRGGGPSGEAKPSISAGDIIRKAGELEIKQVQDLRDATDTITEGATEPVPALITFERDTEEYVTVVKVGIRDIEDPGREVQKAWLPVETQVITRDIAEEMDKAELTGFRITKLYAGSTAETAGLLVGDLLVDVDGEPLRANGPEDADELRELIRQYSIGATAELGVLRNGERITVPVELIRSPMLEREMKKYRDESFEFTARDITFFDKAREQWQEQQPGVLIVEVTPGGWADLGMLSVGDLLVQVNETGLHRVEDVETIMQKLEEAEPESVVFKVLRGVHTYYLEIEPRWEDQQLPGKE